jgi:hypothetical protein
MDKFPWYLQLILAVEFLVGIVTMGVFIALGFWSIQLIKAGIRALDRWNLPNLQRQRDLGPSPREVSPVLAEAQKYGPKI